MKHALAFALFSAPFGVCAAAPASAQSTSDSASSEVVTSTSIGEMIDLVGAMGYEVSRVDRVPGSLRVVSDRGRKFLLSLRICEGADFTLCEALQLTAYRSNVPKASFEMVNELNARQLMSQIYYDANQKVMVSKRFITIKDGVAPANIEANILAFVEMDELLTPMINEIAERQN